MLQACSISLEGVFYQRILVDLVSILALRNNIPLVVFSLLKPNTFWRSCKDVVWCQTYFHSIVQWLKHAAKDEVFSNPSLYWSVVGALLYLSPTCPDTCLCGQSSLTIHASTYYLSLNISEAHVKVPKHTITHGLVTSSSLTILAVYFGVG